MIRPINAKTIAYEHQHCQENLKFLLRRELKSIRM
jgi:hypothetical protein